MGDHEHSTIVTADPDALFGHLSDVHDLPDHFASMRECEPTGESSHGEAGMTRDAERRTLSWGSEGPNSGQGDLHTERADGPGIRAGLEQTLASITQQVEGSSVDEV